MRDMEIRPEGRMNGRRSCPKELWFNIMTKVEDGTDLKEKRLLSP
jgi:hypothetical protein